MEASPTMPVTPQLPPPFVPRTAPAGNLRARTVDWLGSRICAGDLAAGTILNMDDLATERGVSRSVIREAMSVLSSLGLVASRRRVGTVVQPAEEWEMLSADVIRWRLRSESRAQQIMELSELRSAIEPKAAALAAARAKPEECQELRTCLDALLAAAHEKRIPEFHRLDKQFHALVLSIGGNLMFAALHRFVEGMLDARYLQGLMPQEIDPRAVEWHRALGQAIIDGDADDAREAAMSIVRLSAVEMLEMANMVDEQAD